MKLKIKLPLAFAAALGLLFLGAMFGIYQLNQSLDIFEKDVHDTVAAHKKVAEIDAIMATGIQEWKNTLLHHRNATQRNTTPLSSPGLRTKAATSVLPRPAAHTTQAQTADIGLDDNWGTF